METTAPVPHPTMARSGPDSRTARPLFSPASPDLPTIQSATPTMARAKIFRSSGADKRLFSAAPPDIPKAPPRRNQPASGMGKFSRATRLAEKRPR